MLRSPLFRFVVPVALAACGLPAVAQSSGANPDLSGIVSLLYCPFGEADCADPEADGEFSLREVELAIQGYLNPYVRGDLFFGFHAGEVEVEEAYATFVRGLGPFQAKLGRYLLDWGSLNALHDHAYSWIFRPLSEERFFGEEGLAQIGANLDYSLPVGETGELSFSVDVLRGDLFGDAHGGHAGEAEESGAAAGVVCVGPGCGDGVCADGDTDCALVFHDPGTDDEDEPGPDPAYHVQVEFFDEIGPDRYLGLGANALRGTVDPDVDRRVTWFGADIKYRWRPDKYRSLNLIAAWLRSRVDLEAETVVGSVCLGPDCVMNVCPAGGVCSVVDELEHGRGDALTTTGWYALADWQFRKRWNAGVKLDRSQAPESARTVRRAEAFVNWRMQEETTLFRALLRREDGDGYRSADTTAALQLVFSLGPHRPHAF